MIKNKNIKLSVGLIGGLLVSGASCDNGTVATEKKGNNEKPNIILILVDDVGFADFGCTGSEVPTPNIDALAANGILCRNFYNMARSAPTRASLLTGLYAHQAGIGALREIPGKPAYQFYINDNSVLISEILRDNGYFNVMTGKSHIGHFQGVTPIARGFDRSLNAPAGGFYFYDDPTIVDNRDKHLFLNDEELALDDPRLGPEWYVTDLFNDFGLNFIDEAIDNDQPFFWYLAHIAGHFPLQAHPETIAKYKGKYREGWDVIRDERYQKQLDMGLFDESELLTPPNPAVKDWDSMTEEEIEKYDSIMAIYAAVLDELDQSIGRLVQHLKDKGVYDNTVIMFLSDNGGNAEGGYEGIFTGDNPGSGDSRVYLPVGWADVANTPFMYYKHNAHEGGCHTPLIISYPNGIKEDLKGTINKDFYGHIIDIMPTILELTGSEYPQKRGPNNEFDVKPMEGVSLVPLLTGEKVERINPIIVEHEGNKMIRDDKWKLVQELGEPKWNLYDLENDPTEYYDVADEFPEKVEEMDALYHKWAEHTEIDEAITFNKMASFMPVDTYYDEEKAEQYLEENPIGRGFGGMPTGNQVPPQNNGGGQNRE